MGYAAAQDHETSPAISGTNLAQASFKCDVRGRMSNVDFHKDVNEILASFGVITPFKWDPLPTWKADPESLKPEKSYRSDLFRYLVYFDETNKLIKKRIGSLAT